MPPSSITTIISQIDSFPALPVTVSRVIEITGNPESSVQDLMEAILPDQSMCIAILKIANSAFFGSPRKVCSIEEAIITLGFHEIRNIVLTHAVFNSFQKFRNTCKQDVEALWQHSLTCGLAAKIIATHTPGHAPSQFFIAGLIHDIGKLTILMALPNSYSPGPEFSGRLHLPHLTQEEEQLGISHDSVGMRLLNRWLFPEQLCFSAGYHHSPGSAPANAAFPLIIQMADILSHLVHRNEAVNGRELLDQVKYSTPKGDLLWSRYHLDWQPEDIESWLTDLRSNLEDGSLLHLFND